jgi:hypothetical protein
MYRIWLLIRELFLSSTLPNTTPHLAFESGVSCTPGTRESYTSGHHDTGGLRNREESQRTKHMTDGNEEYVGEYVDIDQ